MISIARSVSRGEGHVSVQSGPALSKFDVLAGRYEVLDLIAEGGMALIYLGRQIGLGRHVAIKTLLPHLSRRPEVVARFRREAEAVQRLSHPNTIRIYDFGVTDEDTTYLVMEFLVGQTLDRVLAKVGRLPLAVVVDVGRQVLKSLVEAHGHGIVHRDIKPGNLMLCRQLGELNFVKVLDFGLARLPISDDQPFKTDSGVTLGTPTYMSPEQVAHKRLDARSDIYSLGLTLFELATGKPAYSASGPYEVAMRHLSEMPLELTKPVAGTDLGRVILRAAHKDPAERYPSAEAMLVALERIETGEAAGSLLDELESGDFAYPPLSSSDDEGVEFEDRPTEALSNMVSRRRPRWLGLATVAVLALLGAGLFALAGSDRPTEREPIPSLARSNEAQPSPTDPTSAAASTGDSPAAERATAGPPESSPTPPDTPPVEVTPSLIQMRIDSEPEGATVLLDGQEICTTPCEHRRAAKPRTGRLVISRSGFVPSEHVVALDQNVLLPVALTPEMEERAEVVTDEPSPRTADRRGPAVPEASRELPPVEPGEPEPAAGVEPPGLDDPEVEPTEPRRRLPVDF
jgi:serine/threonine-protein kinase